jgi:hypothetical protein
MQEFKNLERTNFNWFGVKELKNKESLDEAQIKEMMKFTFAPFIPYWVYSFIRTNWDFLLLRYLAIFIFYIFYFVFYFTFIFDIAFRNIKSDLTDNFPNQMLSKGLILIGIALVLFLVLLFAAEICECFFARRLSWNRLSWKDFESYQYSESQWNIAGMVFLAIRILAILGIIAVIVILFLTMKGSVPGFLEQLKNI